MKLIKKKFVPIVIDDEELIKEINKLRDIKAGYKDMFDDIANKYEEVRREVTSWFDKVSIKYNIPEEYRNKLYYQHDKKIIELKRD